MIEFTPYTEEKNGRGRPSNKIQLDPQIDEIFNSLKAKIAEASSEAGYKKKYEDLKKDHDKLLKKFNRLKKIIDVPDEEKEES